MSWDVNEITAAYHTGIQCESVRFIICIIKCLVSCMAVEKVDWAILKENAKSFNNKFYY